MMRKLTEIVLTCLLLSASIHGVETASHSAAANASSLTWLLRGGFFIPTQSEFREIYGSGPALGSELRLSRGHLAAWLEIAHFGRSGKLSETEEATRVKILSLEGGALWRIKPGKTAPYVGAGAGYFQYRETNVIGDARQGKAGFCGLAGLTMMLGQRLILDCRLKYTYCPMQPADFKIDIGGLTAGIGLGMRF
jgi:opacity protein-like surface antigen